MIAVLQRVSSARVEVGGRVTGAIGPGLLMLVCAEPGDSDAIADKLVAKVLKLRIFSDDAGKMNRSVVDIGGGLLVVSQFTLAADTAGGNRPGFSGAGAPELGRRLYERVLATARAMHAGRVRRVRGRHAGAPGQRRPRHHPDHVAGMNAKGRPKAAPACAG